MNLPELEAILTAAREKEHENRKFLAALKGIDLDKGNEGEHQDKFNEIKRRVEARQSGISEATLEMNELGLEIEIEE